MTRPLRQQVYFQLFGSLDQHGRLTVTNKIVVAIIIVLVVVAVLSTEPTIVRGYYDTLILVEMVFGALFLLKYIARIWSIAEKLGPGGAAARRWRFTTSFIGMIDLAVVIASLFPFLVTSASILRIVRLLRLAELMQFGRFSLALREIAKAVSERRYDLFVTVALTGGLILIAATAFYWAEGQAQPEAFGLIPRAMWWAIVTLTAVGYGDVVPVTPLGKVFASFVALSSILLIAVPTGNIAAAFSDGMQRHRTAVEAAWRTRERHHE